MRWRVGVLPLMLAILLTLSGCTQPGTDEGPPKDPELVAQEAIKSFGSATGSLEGGDLKKITGSFATKPQESDSPDDFGMSFEDGSFDLSFEWGKGEVVHTTISVVTGGMTMALDAWCSADRNVIKWGNTHYESRPAASDEEDSFCGDSSEMEGMGDGLDLFGSEEFEGIEITDIQTHTDGSMTVAFHDPEMPNETMTAKIDTKGRLTEITIDSPEISGSFLVTYGARDNIAIPSASQRIPAEVWHHGSSDDDGAWTDTVSSSAQRPLLEEMEARIVLDDWDNDSVEVLATFPTHIEGPQTVNGYTFEYRDLDGDGRVSVNDTMTYSHPSWDEYSWPDEDLELYDLWAESYVNENPVPAAGIAPLLALAALALVFVARRR